jgi:hypothetical protein
MNTGYGNGSKEVVINLNTLFLQNNHNPYYSLETKSLKRSLITIRESHKSLVWPLSNED